MQRIIIVDQTFAIALQASADRAPALLDIAAALAASPRLAPILADSLPPPAGPGNGAVSDALTPCPEPWASEQHLGTRCACEPA